MYHISGTPLKKYTISRKYTSSENILLSELKNTFYEFLGINKSSPTIYTQGDEIQLKVPK